MAHVGRHQSRRPQSSGLIFIALGVRIALSPRRRAQWQSPWRSRLGAVPDPSRRNQGDPTENDERTTKNDEERRKNDPERRRSTKEPRKNDAEQRKNDEKMTKERRKNDEDDPGRGSNCVDFLLNLLLKLHAKASFVTKGPLGSILPSPAGDPIVSISY